VRGAPIELEDGGRVVIDRSREVEAAGADGSRRVALDLRERLPLGVHRLRLELEDGTTTSTQVLSAPERCFEGDPHEGDPREWARERRPVHDRTVPRRRLHAPGARLLGLFAPVHALRSARHQPWAPGDLSDLARLRDWARPLGIDVVGVLPLLAGFLDEPFDPSPYAPVTRLFWSELYLDPALSPDLERSPAAAVLLEGASGGPSPAGGSSSRARGPGAGAAVAAAAVTGGDTELVDYQRTMAAKRRVLEALAQAAFASPARRDEIERFAGAEPQLDEYARFRAAAERERAGWPAWPAAQRSGRLSPADFDESSRRFHLYVQWLWDRQFRELFGHGEDLYLDLPIGVHGGGFDVWRFRDQFAATASVGAPPDLFFVSGQDWGFPPPHPRNARQSGHAYFRSIVRAHLRRAAMLRLDHVMALHRLFWIPRGLRASQGVYVRYPAEELYAILAIESHRHRARIVGENLGTVPPEVDDGLRRHGLSGMRILQFEVSPDWPGGARELDGLAALDTHDTATFAGFWEGTEIDLRVTLGLLSEEEAERERALRGATRSAVVAALRAQGWLAVAPSGADADRSRGADPSRPDAATPGTEEVLDALLRWMSASPAAVVMVQLEDLWLEHRPQNVPGISSEYPSFKRHLERTLDSIENVPAIAGLLRGLAALRHEERP
jgi:4-alpha-glucanotransferase